MNNVLCTEVTHPSSNKKTVNITISTLEVHGRLCNPSYWDSGIWGCEEKLFIHKGVHSNKQTSTYIYISTTKSVWFIRGHLKIIPTSIPAVQKYFYFFNSKWVTVYYSKVFKKGNDKISCGMKSLVSSPSTYNLLKGLSDKQVKDSTGLQSTIAKAESSRVL